MISAKGPFSSCSGTLHGIVQYPVPYNKTEVYPVFHEILHVPFNFL